MNSALIALVQNVTVLLATMVVFDLLTSRRPLIRNDYGLRILVGLMLGVLCVGLMAASFRLENGIIFDARSVLLSLSGLFFGWVPTALAMAIAAAYRLWHGGAGVWTGLAVIVATGGAGILWRRYRSGRLADITPQELFGFGVVVHLIMLALMLTLPWETAQRTLAAIALPVLLVFPIATIAIGWLLSNRLRREDAARATAESELRFRKLFQNNHAVMLLIDPQSGEILDANPAAERFYGWSRDDLVQKRITDINTLSPSEVREEMEAARAAERNHFLFRHRIANGELRDVEVFSGQISVEGRDILCSIIHDVTERHRVERTLLESEARFRALIEGAPDAVFVQSDYRFAFINDAGVKLFGAESPEELIGQPVMDRFRSDFHPVIQARIRGLNEQGEPQGPLEEVWLRLDGTEVPVDVSARPIQFQGRGGALVFARDISVRKAYERRLDSNTRLLGIASHTAHIGGWEVDLQSERVVWSDEVSRIHGVPPGTTITVAEGIAYYAPEWRNLITERFTACARDGTPYDEELEILNASGQRVWVRTVGAAVYDEQGHVVRVEGAFQDISDRHDTQLRLRESEAKLRAITDASPDPILMTDETGKLVYCNPAVESVLGYRQTEMLGQDMHRAIAPASYHASIARGYKAFARSGTGPIVGTTRELTALHRDGREIPVEISVSSLQLEGRWHAVGILRDHTTRKGAERRLALEARRAEALLELPKTAERVDEVGFMQRGQELAKDLTDSRIAFVHFVHEDQNMIELVTWSCRTLSDYCEVPVGQTHYPVEDAGIWADALRQHKPVVYNDYRNAPNRHGLPEGHAVLHRLISVPVIENGKVTMLAVVGNKDSDYTDMDVETVQLIAEQIWSIVQRRRSEQRLRQLSLAIEQSPDSIVITNLAAEIEYVNEAFLRTTGYQRSDVLGQNPRILQSGKTPQQHYDSMWAALTRGEPWTGEFCNRRKDGTEYVEFGHVAPLRQPSGEITNYIAVKEDITEKKNLGLELDRHRHHLEELVAQRTVELTQAQREAESANRAKSAFLANMSHEIRTPMNGVLGMVELLWNTELTDEQANMLETIRDSGRSLTKLIDDILDFSKIEAGQMEIEQAPLSVREVVEGLCISLAPLAHHRDVHLSCFVAPEIPERVFGDEARLRQMLYNLIGNGIKFSCGPKAGHRAGVCVRVEPSAADPFRILFMISDNGVGISGGDQARLFQPFTQAEASTARRFGGTGLGLSICKRLTDLMGGDIAVDSALGQGSTFTLALPFVIPPDQPTPALPDLTGVHCLLIESSAFYANVRGANCGTGDIIRHLEHAGATVDVFRDDAVARSTSNGLGKPVVMVQLGEPAGSALGHRPAGSTPLPEIQIRWGVKNVLSPSGPVLLDAAAITRADLLRAVAVAVGRVDVPSASGAHGQPARFLPEHVGAASAGARILVVEDDVTNRKVIQKQLETLGYHTDLTVNGVEALQRWRDEKYDLVLTDLHMPEMDGYELIRRIREEEATAAESGKGYPRTPIIALTANALRGEAEKGLGMGMDAYLTKPLELRTLESALQLHLAPAANHSRGAEPQRGAGEPGPAIIAPPLFDVDVLKNLIGDERETLEMILREYLTTLARTWEEIESAAAQADSAAIGAAAHKLKSSSRSVGAMRLGELCAQLESAGRASDMEGIPSLLLQALDVRPELEDAVQSFLQGRLH